MHGWVIPLMGASVICDSFTTINRETEYSLSRHQMVVVKEFVVVQMKESGDVVEVKEEEEATENEEVLKRMISGHPLFGRLLENHLNCLQVGGISFTSKFERLNQEKVYHKPHGVMAHSELDSFMEAYCLALTKLKEAMEEPQLETATFFNSVYLQLENLTTIASEPDHTFTDNNSGAAKWGSQESTNPDVANDSQA